MIMTDSPGSGLAATPATPGDSDPPQPEDLRSDSKKKSAGRERYKQRCVDSGSGSGQSAGN